MLCNELEWMWSFWIYVSALDFQELDAFLEHKSNEWIYQIIANVIYIDFSKYDHMMSK